MNKKEWREEFREKFGRFYVDIVNNTIDLEGEEIIASDDIEHFIQQKLDEKEKEVVEIIKEKARIGQFSYYRDEAVEIITLKDLDRILETLKQRKDI